MVSSPSTIHERLLNDQKRADISAHLAADPFRWICCLFFFFFRYVEAYGYCEVYLPSTMEEQEGMITLPILLQNPHVGHVAVFRYVEAYGYDHGRTRRGDNAAHLTAEP